MEFFLSLLALEDLDVSNRTEEKIKYPKGLIILNWREKEIKNERQFIFI